MSASDYTKSRTRFAWLFMSPSIFILLGIAGWPLARTIWYSLTDANLSDLKSAEFVGLENFSFIFQDDEWITSIKNTLYFAFCSVGLETIFGMIVALVVHQQFKGKGWLRAAILIPWAIPTIVSARMWGWMLHDVYGVINEILLSLHIISAPKAWTASPTLAMISVIIVDVWKTTPFMALLILAGLQMLPHECFEAARVDGIHPLRVFWRVTLPLLWPTLIIAFLFRMLDALRVFDLIYVLTSGNSETISMSIYARQQLFDFQNVGMGSAASTSLFIMISILAVFILGLGRIKKEDWRRSK